ncbi:MULTISPECIES: GreA/GreB family elongation factor [Lactiplantibacillus]|nr:MULTISPECIES: GreA/GreB family elongation factor [Lactiplantibacillus]MDY1543376.1 GreA/GreB family elongation factor [Lactiplantibacillus pentosus]
MICKNANQTGKVTTAENLDDHGQITYQLVGKREANLEQPRISFTSPSSRRSPIIPLATCLL